MKKNIVSHDVSMSNERPDEQNVHQLPCKVPSQRSERGGSAQSKERDESLVRQVSGSAENGECLLACKSLHITGNMI